MCFSSSLCFAASNSPAPNHPDFKNAGGGSYCDPDDPSNYWPLGSNAQGNLPIAQGSRIQYGAPKVMGRSAVSEVLGTTPEQVQKKFAGVINAQFQYGATERLVAQLSDRELSDLAHFYQQSGGPIANSPLLKTFARRLSDKSLLRVASAFDRFSLVSCG